MILLTEGVHMGKKPLDSGNEGLGPGGGRDLKQPPKLGAFGNGRGDWGAQYS